MRNRTLVRIANYNCYKLVLKYLDGGFFVAVDDTN